MKKVAVIHWSWHMEGGGWWVTFYIFSFNLCFVLLFPLMMLFVPEKQLIKQQPFLANYKRAPLLEGLEGKWEKKKKTASL